MTHEELQPVTKQSYYQTVGGGVVIARKEGPWCTRKPGGDDGGSCNCKGLWHGQVGAVQPSGASSTRRHVPRRAGVPPSAGLQTF